MKKLTLMAATLMAGVLFIGANSVNAQSKLSFGLNVGYSAPSGDFSSTDASKQPVVASPSTDTTHISGYAKGGFHFDIYATYMFSPIVGGMISVGGSMNSYDIAALDANIVTANGGSSAILPTESGSYYAGQYLIGPYVCIPTPGKLKIELKALFGLTAVNYPTLSYSYSSFGFSGTGSIAVKSASGFGYNVGAGLKYMLTDNIGLHFDVSYGGSSVKYPGYTQTQTATGYPSQSVTHSSDLDMSLGLIEVTVGGSIDL